MAIKQKYVPTWLLALLPALIYVVWRAASLSFTYDEAWSALGYATQPVGDVILNTFPAANNHVLMSLCMKLGHALFGFNEFAFRLPALLAFVVYGRVAHLLAVRLCGRMWWLAFAALCYHPYLLDYFSAARGYALALCFMLLTVECALRYLQTAKHAFLISALAAGFAMVYANFSYAIVYAGIAISIVLYGYCTKTPVLKSHIVTISISFLVSICVFFLPIKRLIDAHELYYGGNSGFFADTLQSLSAVACYDTTPRVWLSAVFAALMLGSAAVAVFSVVKKPTYHSVFLLLLPSTVAVNLLQRAFFGTPYPTDRTAMFYLPLMMLAWLAVAASLKEARARVMMQSLVAVFTLVVTATGVNLTYLLDFRDYADFNVAMRDVQVDYPADGRPFRLGKSTYMNATINFYARKYGMHYIEQSGLEYCAQNGTHPYYYVFARDTHCLANEPVAVVKRYPTSGTVLYKEIVR